MPAKTTDRIIDQAVAMYCKGYSSTDISKALNISASLVVNKCRELGITRNASEAKKLYYQQNPIPFQTINRDKIYRASESVTKQCASCKRTLPATTEFFYKRKRKNSRIYLSSSCKECTISQIKDYRKKNPEKVKEALKRSREKNGHLYQKQKELRKLFDPVIKQRTKDRNREWQQNNQAPITIYRQAYYQENKEAIKQRDQRWRTENPLQARAPRANRKARMKNAEGSFLHTDIQEKLEKQNNLCFWCESPLETYHIDHLTPIAKGGSNFSENIVISCPTCNISRGDKLEHEFREYMQFVEANKEKIEEKRKYLREAMQKHRQKKQTASMPPKS